MLCICIISMCAGLCLLAIVVVVEHQGSGGVTRAPVSGAWVLARGPPESIIGRAARVREVERAESVEGAKVSGYR